MDCEKRHEIQQWLLKSRRDLEAAGLLFESKTSLLDVVVYHCQQSAEKAFKAYLTYQDVVFQKTHNLSVLLDLCDSFDAAFDDLRNFAETLTPYATEFRYPGDMIEPERQDAEEAIEIATLILIFVIQKLPDTVSEQFEPPPT